MKLGYEQGARKDRETYHLLLGAILPLVEKLRLCCLITCMLFCHDAFYVVLFTKLKDIWWLCTYSITRNYNLHYQLYHDFYYFILLCTLSSIYSRVALRNKFLYYQGIIERVTLKISLILLSECVADNNSTNGCHYGVITICRVLAKHFTWVGAPFINAHWNTGVSHPPHVRNWNERGYD